LQEWQEKMTRKDFELIAEAIREMEDAYTGDDWTINGARSPFASKLADKLETTNPRFNRELFLKACGV
jgi:hypothetical protein